MNTKNKIIIVCVCASVILLICFYEIQQFSRKNYEHNIQSNLENQSEILHAIIDFKSEYLEKITIDYACFDEMIDFINSKDSVWAKSNITILTSYKLQSVWVYNLEKKLIYFDKDSLLKNNVTFNESVYDTLLKKRHSRYFVNTPDGILEISGSTIHTSSDIERKLSPHGFIFIGKLWNATILNTISQFTHSDVSFVNPKNNSVPSDEFSVVSYPLHDFNGKNIASLYSAKKDISVKYINKLSIYIYLFYGVSAFLIILIFILSFDRYFIRPLNNIALTLKKENPAYIKNLAQGKNEFSAIAKLILDFFEQKKQLISLNSTKDKFFSIIAHDLRGPLMGLHGLSSLLHKKVEKMEKEKIEQISLALFKASENVSQLMENLLQWAQTQVDNIEFSPQNMSLKNIADTCILNINSMAINKEIRIINNISEDITVTADENLLKFIIRNLIGNGIKYTPKGGSVTLDATAMSQSVEISVKDTGIGMSAKQLERLFKIDSISSVSGTEKESGTGLGLILCKEFVEKHGGLIYASSKEGNGSTFAFTIPVIN